MLALALLLPGIGVGCGASESANVPNTGSAEPSPEDAASPRPSPTTEPGSAKDTNPLLSAYETLASVEVGFYVERVFMDGGLAMTTWANYRPDLRDYRIGLWVDPENEPTAEKPSLRFIVDRESVVMWNPTFEEQCGNPWVDMTDATGDVLNDSFGMGWEPGPLPPIKPLEMLADGIDRAERIAPDEFVVPVNALSALPASLSTIVEQPDLAELLDQDVEAFIELEGDWIREVEISFTALMEEISGERAPLVMHWAIGEGEPPVAWDLPDTVADGACMETGSAA